jgi:hypothetical protein
VNDEPCKAVRTCKRDGVQQQELHHDWGDWRREKVIKSVQYDIRRFDDTLLIPHDEYWEGGTKTEVSARYCSRCPAREEK